MSWLPVGKNAVLERDWKDQYERVLRWRKRLASAKPSGPSDVDALKTYRDYAHAYFVNCYHLRDWLISKTRPAKMVDCFIDRNLNLKACRGICDAVKHFRLTRYPEDHKYREYLAGEAGTLVASSTGFSGEVDGWAPAGRRPGDYIVETPCGDFEVQTLADDCLAAWRSFLKYNDLDSGSSPGAKTTR